MNNSFEVSGFPRQPCNDQKPHKIHPWNGPDWIFICEGVRVAPPKPKWWQFKLVRRR